MKTAKQILGELQAEALYKAKFLDVPVYFGRIKYNDELELIEDMKHTYAYNKADATCKRGPHGAIRESNWEKIFIKTNNTPISQLYEESGVLQIMLKKKG